MTTLNIRIDEKVKEDARKTFALMGLDISGAVKLFLNQAILEQSIPFTPTNKYPSKIRIQWDKEIAQALKEGKRYKTAREMHEAILGKKTYARLSKQKI